MEKLNVWIHCRVISDNDRELLTYQEKLLSKAANDLDMKIVGINKEVSRGKFLDSYGMREMKSSIKRGNVNIVLIYSKKRISIYEDIYEEFEMFCDAHSVIVIALKDLEQWPLTDQF